MISTKPVTEIKEVSLSVICQTLLRFGIANLNVWGKMILKNFPNLSNVWQITLKDTSLISVTGLVEIMRQSYIAAGSTRDPLFFYSFAAVLYLLLTFLSMKLINKLEAKYRRGY